MFTKTDSDVTYCSEVEEMLKACNTPLNKTGNNLPLRRSQRLSQKLKKTCEQQIKVIASESVSAERGVPLDLSYKSKESTVETLRLQIDEHIFRKHSLEVVKINDKGRRVGSQKLIYRNKAQRRRISSCNVPPNKVLKKGAIKTQRITKQTQVQNKSFKKSFENQSKNNIRRVKNVNSSKKNFTENNATDLATIQKLSLKHEEKTMLSNKSSTNKAAHPRKRRPRKTTETTGSIEDIKIGDLKNKQMKINFLEKHSNAIKPPKRERKRKHKPGEILSKPNTEPNNSQSAHHIHVQVSDETENSCQTKIEENNKKSTKKPKIYRSQSSITKKKFSGQTNVNTYFANEHKKIKLENASHKFYVEGLHASGCLQKTLSATPSKVCCQFAENTFSIKEAIKHESQDGKSNTKLFQSQTNFNALHNAEAATKDCKNENPAKNSLLNKNYLQSFDKNQFLDKIRSARSYVDHLPVKNKNTYEIPPSPVESSQELLKKSILFNAYPAHFKHQLPPEAILTQSLHPQPLPTPDDTISSELLESSSSSPSLPESLCELFKTKDIKDILNLKQNSYHLNSYHIQAMALILNLQIEYLVKILDKVVNTSPDVLKNIERAMKTPFAPDNDLFSNSSNEFWSSSNVVPNSQSPKQRNMSCRPKQ